MQNEYIERSRIFPRVNSRCCWAKFRQSSEFLIPYKPGAFTRHVKSWSGSTLGSVSAVHKKYTVRYRIPFSEPQQQAHMYINRTRYRMHRTCAHDEKLRLKSFSFAEERAVVERKWTSSLMSVRVLGMWHFRNGKSPLEWRKHTNDRIRIYNLWCE